jgi:hypothetical protein
MPRPQFALKTLLWLMAVVAAFCAGERLGRERQRREDVGAAEAGMHAAIARAEAMAADAEQVRAKLGQPASQSPRPTH